MVLIVAAVVFGDLQSRLISIGLQSLPARKGRRSLCPSIVWQQPFWFLFLGLDWLLWSFLTFACRGSSTKPNTELGESAFTKRQIVVLKQLSFSLKTFKTRIFPITGQSFFPTKKNVTQGSNFWTSINLPNKLMYTLSQILLGSRSLIQIVMHHFPRNLKLN